MKRELNKAQCQLIVKPFTAMLKSLNNQTTSQLKAVVWCALITLKMPFGKN